jgi:Phage tail tube protein, GTA-gp10
MSDPASPKASQNLIPRPCRIFRAWADGEYWFALPVGMIRELEAKRDAGCIKILRRFGDGDWRFDDIREAIRCGAIGGGDLNPAQVTARMKTYVDSRPQLEWAELAREILECSLIGPPGETFPKSVAAAETSEATAAATDASASPTSTPGVPSLASRPPRSTRSRSGNSTVALPDMLPPTPEPTASSRRHRKSSTA